MTYNGATCSCGSTWFELRTDDGKPGAVAFDQDGGVAGFSGQPVCQECGEAWVPTRDRMRLVR